MKTGFIVSIYTEVFLLPLCRSDDLGREVAVIMGTAKYRRKILLRPINEQLGTQEDKNTC